MDASFLASYDNDGMAAKAKELILSEQYDFIFVDFDNVDSVGHDTGFSGYNLAYRNRVISVDAWIGAS